MVKKRNVIKLETGEYLDFITDDIKIRIENMSGVLRIFEVRNNKEKTEVTKYVNMGLGYSNLKFYHYENDYMIINYKGKEQIIKTL